MRVAVIEGDGIGREVIPAALGVVGATGVAIDWDILDEEVLADRFLKTGTTLTDDEFARIAGADAILLGAIGDPRITDPRYTKQTLLRIREELDLYANVRPARLRDDRLSPLRKPGTVDLTVVRENTEGLYSGIGVRHAPGTTREVAVQEHVSTYHGVSRVIRYAFSIAAEHVVMAHKANAMPHAGALWRRCFADGCAGSAVPGRAMAIDACAMHMIEDPGQFEVIVTENCFGDILSDIAALLAGGIGMAPSANVNPETGRAMFEPVHGSAPDIAGEDIANPVAAIASCALMLRHLGFPAEARAVDDAVVAAVRVGKCTRDIGGSLSTGQAAAAIARRLR